MFGKLLTKYRDRMNPRVSKTKLARDIGVHPSFIMGIENGTTKAKPSVETLNKIVDRLDLSDIEAKELKYYALSEKLEPAVLDIIQDYRAGFIAEQAIKEGIHGHQTAYAECPYCHKDFAIDVKGEDITVTGKVITKAKKV